MSQGSMCLTCRKYISPEAWGCKCEHQVVSDDGVTPAAPNVVPLVKAPPTTVPITYNVRPLAYACMVTLKRAFKWRSPYTIQTSGKRSW